MILHSPFKYLFYDGLISFLENLSNNIVKTKEFTRQVRDKVMEDKVIKDILYFEHIMEYY